MLTHLATSTKKRLTARQALDAYASATTRREYRPVLEQTPAEMTEQRSYTDHRTAATKMYGANRVDQRRCTNPDVKVAQRRDHRG